jgi:hypothetical protein
MGLLSAVGRGREEGVGRTPVGRGRGDQVGQTQVADRALAAFGMRNGRRCDAERQQGVEAVGGVLGTAAEVGVKDDLAPPPRPDMVDGPCGDGDAEGLLQAERLGAELDLVVVPAAAPAALVLDGVGDFGAAGGDGAELDEVRDADEPEAVTDDPQAAGGAERGLVAVAGGVDAPVIEGAGRGVDVVEPEALQPMEGATARAEQEIVQGR